MHGPAHRHALAKPPLAPRRPHTTTWHGVELVDDYAWLRDDNWQEVMRDPSGSTPEIRAYLEAENAYCDAQLSDTQSPAGRPLHRDEGAPQGGRQHRAGARWPLRLLLELRRRWPVSAARRRPRDGGAETVLLDGNDEAEGKRYWDLGSSHHSPDHTLLAYSGDDKGSELYTIRIRDLRTGRTWPTSIPDTRGGLVWAQRQPHAVLRAPRRPPPPAAASTATLSARRSTDDVLVYEEKDIGFYVGIGLDAVGASSSLIDAHDHQTSEVYLIDADAPTAPIAPGRAAPARPRVLRSSTTATG